MENAASEATLQKPKKKHDGTQIGERRWSRRLRDVPTNEGRKAEPCINYLPTRQELEQLTRYWFWELLEASFYTKVVDPLAVKQLQSVRLCNSKLDALEHLLGTTMSYEIYGECLEDFENFVGAEQWQKFDSGYDKTKRN